MFYFINKQTVLQRILLATGCILLIFRWIIGTPEFTFTSDMPSFSHGLSSACLQYPLLFKSLVIFNFILQLFLLYICFARNEFSEKRATIMPLVFYVWLMNGIVNPLHITNFFFINTIILFMFNISIQLNNPSLKGKVFMLGLLIGIGSFLSASMLLLFFYSLVSILIYRYSRSKEIVILLLGILCPYIYLIAIGYLCNQVIAFTPTLHELTIFNWSSTFHNPVVARLLLPLCVLMLIIIVTQKIYFDSKIIIQRQRLTTIAAFTLTALFIILADSTQSPYNLQYLFVPACIYFSIMSSSKRLHWRHDALIILCITIFLLLNFLPR